jgi:hypothetical protein
LLDVKECSSTGDKAALTKYRAEQQYEREYERGVQQAQGERYTAMIKREPTIKSEDVPERDGFMKTEETTKS